MKSISVDAMRRSIGVMMMMMSGCVGVRADHSEPCTSLTFITANHAQRISSNTPTT